MSNYYFYEIFRLHSFYKFTINIENRSDALRGRIKRLPLSIYSENSTKTIYYLLLSKHLDVIY